MMMRWIPPAVFLLLSGVLYLTDSNRYWFTLLNAVGPVTGDSVWANITLLGDTLVALVLCLPLWRRRPDLIWALVFALILGTLWARGLKPLVDIARPAVVITDGLHVIGKAYTAQAFPSGHATTAFTIGGLIAMGLGRRPYAVLALTLACLVGVSRAVVGVHWPLDILAGAFGGWLCAVLALYLGKKTFHFGSRPWAQWTLGLALAIGAAALVYPYQTDYPDSLILQRAIGLACLVSAGARLNRDFRRRPGL